MTYQINLTNGSLLTEIVDSSIDQQATDLTLIGKNVSGYGEYINENFIKILENFAAETEPNNPLIGQIWFDTAENRLKVYDGNGFKIGSGPIVSGTRPLSFSQGDLWIDSTQNQLYFYDGIDLQLAGPIYKESQGRCGFVVEDIVDTNGSAKTIVKLLVNDVLLGIFSTSSLSYTPSAPISGYTGDIYPGFNEGTLPGSKWRLTATKADALLDVTGQLKTPSNFMKTDENTATTGTLSVVNPTPLILGTDSNIEVTTDPFLTLYQHNALNANVRFKIRNNAGYQEPLTFIASTKKVGIFTPNPAYTLDVTGDARITGSLIVNGSTTSISTSNLSIQDHQIELAVNDDSSVSDTYADQGGLVLRGTTNHTIIWDQGSTSWRMSENLDIREASSGARAYKINGVNVLEYTGSIFQLSASVTSAPGITSFGPQTSLTVDNIFIDNNRISSTNANGDVEIEPNGSGNVVLIGSPKITGLSDPIAATDAVTKQYVDNSISSRNICFSMDITGLNDTQIADQLEQIAPSNYYEIGTEARIHCTIQNVSYTNIQFTASPTGDFVKSYVSVDKSDNVGTQPSEPVLQDFSINPINLGPATITVTRVNKLFELVSDSTTSVWQWQMNF
jgi:hypothetical protein